MAHGGHGIQFFERAFVLLRFWLFGKQLQSGARDARTSPVVSPIGKRLAQTDQVATGFTPKNHDLHQKTHYTTTITHGEGNTSRGFPD